MDLKMSIIMPCPRTPPNSPSLLPVYQAWQSPVYPPVVKVSSGSSRSPVVTMIPQAVSPTVLRGLPVNKREAVARVDIGIGRSASPWPRRRLFPELSPVLGTAVMPNLLDQQPPMTTSRRLQRPLKVDQRDYWSSN